MKLNKYDRQVLPIIFGLTVAVVLLIWFLSIVTSVTLVQWIPLPLSWLVGALMVWSYGKWKYARVAE